MGSIVRQFLVTSAVMNKYQYQTGIKKSLLLQKHKLSSQTKNKLEQSQSLKQKKRKKELDIMRSNEKKKKL